MNLSESIIDFQVKKFSLNTLAFNKSNLLKDMCKVTSYDTVINYINEIENITSNVDKDDSIILQFTAGKLDIKEVIDYCFHELLAQDLKISEISIEDVVKNLLEEAEENAKKV